MTDTNERHTLITPAGYHNMRGLFAEHACSHEAKTARAEGLIETLDDERELTHAECQMCIEGLELVISQTRVNAELLRDGVAEIDAAAIRQQATAADTASTTDEDHAERTPG